MRLINESNWKQEIAKLKAQRILVGKGLDESLKHTSGFLSESQKQLLQQEEQLDKAIETIENVFVHKQCWIDI